MYKGLFRELVTALQIIHRTLNGEEISAARFTARKLFEVVPAGYGKLDSVVPAGQYYCYNDHWRYAPPRLCFLAALVCSWRRVSFMDKITTAELMGQILLVCPCLN